MEKTFEEIKKPIVHPTKRGLKAVSSIPILPDDKVCVAPAFPVTLFLLS